MDMTFRTPIVKHLVFRDLYMNRKSILIFFGVLVGLLSLFGSIAKMDQNGPNPDFHFMWYGTFFFIFGIFQTGGVYTEFAQPATRQDYLLLPASHLEKWVSRWFRTLPLYILAFTLIYWVASWIMNLICLAAFGEFYLTFQPFHNEIFSFWKIFIVIHAVFSIGAIHYNKAATMKTTLTLFILLFAISLIGGMTAWSLFQSMTEGGVIIKPAFSFKLSEHMNYLLGITGKIILWFGLVPLFWWISYLKLNEKEV